MSLTWTVQPVLSVEDPTWAFSQAGCYITTSGDCLFGFTQGAEPGVTHWYRSRTNGKTWQPYSQSRGTGNFDFQWGANTPPGVIVYPCYDYAFDKTFIFRTVNGGASWTQVAEWQSNSGPPSRSVWCTQIISLKRSQYIAAGQFEPVGDQPQKYLAVSTDNGVNWTTRTAFDAGDEGSFCSAITNAGGGVLYAATREWADLAGFPYVYKSTNHGTTWSHCGSLPLPTGCSGAGCYVLETLSKDIVLAGGSGADDSNGQEPYCWRSTNGGGSWTRLAAADISVFQPTTNHFSGFTAIRRLSPEAALISCENYNQSGHPIWAISVDSGAHYTITAAYPNGSWPNSMACWGRIAITSNGNILLPAWCNRGGDNIQQEVWLGSVRC